MKHIFFLGLIIIACQNKQRPRIHKPVYISYYVEEVGYNKLKGFQHYVFISDTIDISDASLLKFSEAYKLLLKKNLPLSGITFITDTAAFPKDYDEQHWDKIRNTFYKDITYDFRPGSNFSKPRELSRWKDGNRIESKQL